MISPRPGVNGSFGSDWAAESGNTRAKAKATSRRVMTASPGFPNVRRQPTGIHARRVADAAPLARRDAWAPALFHHHETAERREAGHREYAHQDGHRGDAIDQFCHADIGRHTIVGRA